MGTLVGTLREPRVKPAINHWTDLCRRAKCASDCAHVGQTSLTEPALSLGSAGPDFTRGGTAPCRTGRPDCTDDGPAPCDIFVSIFMPTTVHIPDPLLKSVDRRAKALGISRNRLVVRALEQAVRVRSGWAPEFLDRLRRVDPETSAATDELLEAIQQARRSKKPLDL